MQGTAVSNRAQGTSRLAPPRIYRSRYGFLDLKSESWRRALCLVGALLYASRGSRVLDRLAAPFSMGRATLACLIAREEHFVGQALDRHYLLFYFLSLGIIIFIFSSIRLRGKERH